MFTWEKNEPGNSETTGKAEEPGRVPHKTAPGQKIQAGLGCARDLLTPILGYNLFVNPAIHRQTEFSPANFCLTGKLASHRQTCSYRQTDRRSKIAQVRQTSVEDSSSPTDVGQRQLKSDRRRSKIAQVRQKSVKDSLSPTDVGQRQLKSGRRRSKIAHVRQTSVKYKENNQFSIIVKHKKIITRAPEVRLTR